LIEELDELDKYVKVSVDKSSLQNIH
jgi:hypothetical protein